MKKVRPRVARTPNPVFDKQVKNREEISMQLIKQARSSGQLNLSNRSLVEVPDIVCNINSFTPEETKSLSMSMESRDDDRWWDQVELTKLILAFNSLRSIPPAIQALSSLTVLDLHDNQLSALPSTIQELKHLSKLNLSQNKFQEIPSEIFQLKELKYLLMQKNNLQNVNDDIGNLSSLEELDLSHNKLVGLPQTVGFLSRVFKFTINHNKLEKLPSEIGGMLAIRILELSNNSLEEIPASIAEMNHLEMLYVQHNKLKSFPTLKESMNLKELHLGDNCISQLTSEQVEALPQICLLDLRDNKIASIPDEMANVVSLQRLDISNNSLTSLPYTLGTLPHLTSLQIEGNSLRSIRRDIIMRGTAQVLKWLRSKVEDPASLKLPSAGRRSRPSSGESRPNSSNRNIDIYSMKTSRTFDYSKMQSMIIPDELFPMAKEANVSIVNFSKNHLTEIPERLEMLSSKLIELHLGFNKISSIPSFLSTCSHMTFLDLRSNQLSELPNNLNSLKQMREICLSFNRFTSMPEVLFEMPKLEIIILSDNQVESINVDGLSKLKSLATLDLANNNIRTLPPELGRIEQLRSLQVEGNTFRYPRHAILAKGTAHLLQFLRDQLI